MASHTAAAATTVAFDDVSVFVSPGYFRTLSMPILKGRSIEDRDRSSAVTPAAIWARAAETLWPGGDPIGHQFSRGNPDAHFLVVGVVADGHATRIDAPSPPMVLHHGDLHHGVTKDTEVTKPRSTELLRDLRVLRSS